LFFSFGRVTLMQLREKEVAFAVVFVMIAGATGSHAIARAAYRSGIKPIIALDDALSKVEK